MILKINVNGQVMRAPACHILTNNSQEFVRFVFYLTEDWDDLTAFAQFRQGTNSYNAYLDADNSCCLPAEIKAGKVTMMLYGTGGDVIGTTNAITMCVNDNGFVSDAQSTVVSSSLYQQMINEIRAATAITDERTRAAVQAWLDAHPEALTSVGTGTIDNTLTVQGAAAEAKKTGEHFFGTDADRTGKTPVVSCYWNSTTAGYSSEDQFGVANMPRKTYTWCWANMFSDLPSDDITGNSRIRVERIEANGSNSGTVAIFTVWSFHTHRLYMAEYISDTLGPWHIIAYDEMCYMVSGRMEVGLLSYASGKGYMGNATDTMYNRSEMLYEVEPGAKLEIELQSLPFSGHGLIEINVLFYRENGTYNGDYKTTTTSNPFTATVPDGCRFAKISSYGHAVLTGNGEEVERNETFTIKSNRPIIERPNLNLTNTTAAGVTTIGDDDAPVEFRGQTFRTLAFTYNIKPGVRTSGRLLLPPNYDIRGEKVPLIVYVHGTNSMMNRSSQLGKFSQGSYIPYLQYLADEGFAVFDCYPWSYKVEFSSDTSSPMLLRSHIDAYLSGIRYVCSHFNVDIDQVSMLCKSQGGYIGWWAMSQNEFPFRCVALFAPWGVHTGTLFFANDQNNKRIRQAVLNELDLSGTAEEKEAFVNSGNSLDNGIVQGFCEAEGNWQKLLGTVSVLYGVEDVENGLSADQSTPEGQAAAAAAKDLFTRVRTGSSAVPQWIVEEGMGSPSASGWHITAGANNKGLVKRSTCPSKIWASMDDAAVSGYDSYAGYNWLRNGGGDTEFRRLPDGTGGHHAMDTDTNALKVSSAFTTELGVSYAADTIPLAYYEAAEWIKSKNRPDLVPYATKDWVKRGCGQDISELKRLNTWSISKYFGNFSSATQYGATFTWDSSHTVCDVDSGGEPITGASFFNVMSKTNCQNAGIVPGGTYYFVIETEDPDNLFTELYWYIDGVLSNTPAYTLRKSRLITIPLNVTAFLYRIRARNGEEYFHDKIRAEVLNTVPSGDCYKAVEGIDDKIGWSNLDVTGSGVNQVLSMSSISDGGAMAFYVPTDNAFSAAREEIATKVGKFFGTGNAGKVLVVGRDGYVKAVTMSDLLGGNY